MTVDLVLKKKCGWHKNSEGRRALSKKVRSQRKVTPNVKPRLPVQLDALTIKLSNQIRISKHIC